jgi:hypothetical protein
MYKQLDQIFGLMHIQRYGGILLNQTPNGGVAVSNLITVILFYNVIFKPPSKILTNLEKRFT